LEFDPAWCARVPLTPALSPAYRGEDDARHAWHDVGLQVRDAGVGGDDVGEAVVADERQVRAAQVALVPEAVAVARMGELVDEDALERRPDVAAASVIFGQTTDPQVDIVDAAVTRLELGG